MYRALNLIPVNEDSKGRVVVKAANCRVVEVYNELFIKFITTETVTT